MRRDLVVDGRFPLPARRLESLVQQLLKVSKQEAARVIHEGSVQVNGRFTRKPAAVLEPGDRLRVEYEPPVPAVREEPAGGKQKVEIVYSDAQIVVVEKAAALLTVPTPYREKVTLISLLEKKLQAPAYCVHRLDRGVSGLLVFGKELAITEALRDQFAERKPERVYVAIVSGNPPQRAGTFRSHLATDKELNRYSVEDESAGELAITHYRVVEQLAGAALVEVQLETGRRNQIRVHFAEAGHPVLGDARYGRNVRPPTPWHHRRLALHAQTLGFTHPVTGAALRFESPLPRQMQEYLERSRRSARRSRDH
jgi:23S rRNA pseudouridine1911/1915/1917 synthase